MSHSHSSHSPQELDAKFRDAEQHLNRLTYRSVIRQVSAEIQARHLTPALSPLLADSQRGEGVSPALLTRCIGPMVLTQLKVLADGHQV